MISDADPAARALYRLGMEAGLSPVLLDRLRLISTGITYGELASVEHISVNTVKTQIGVILKALGIEGSNEIIRGVRAARRRAARGASEEEILEFLRLRFE